LRAICMALGMYIRGNKTNVRSQETRTSRRHASAMIDDLRANLIPSSENFPTRFVLLRTLRYTKSSSHFFSSLLLSVFQLRSFKGQSLRRVASKRRAPTARSASFVYYSSINTRDSFALACMPFSRLHPSSAAGRFQSSRPGAVRDEQYFKELHVSCRPEIMLPRNVPGNTISCSV